MTKTTKKYHMWQNGMCITYNLIFKKMENFIKLNGGIITADINEADYVVIGACAAFLPYFDKYADKVKCVNYESSKLVVYGCLPIVNRDFVREHTPRIDLYIPTRHPERIEKILDRIKYGWDAVEPSSDFRDEDYTEYNPFKKFISIQQGCSGKCKYCPHRMSIGRETSRGMTDILNQINRDLDRAARIITLEGNNCGSWGLDLKPPMSIQDLVKAISTIQKEFELHICNFAPQWLLKYPELFYDKLITDVKIPIQSSSERLLNVMGRETKITSLGCILKKIKENNPDIVLRTDIIIGMPTETEDEFIGTLDFVNTYFDKVACYSYDYHPNSLIARTNMPQLSSEIIEKRIEKAMRYFAESGKAKGIFDDRGEICQRVTSRLSQTTNG